MKFKWTVSGSMEMDTEGEDVELSDDELARWARQAAFDSLYKSLEYDLKIERVE